MTVEAENKKTVLAFVDAVNQKNWPALNQLVAPDFVRHSTAAGSPPANNRDDLVTFLKNEYEAFPDGHEVVRDLVAEGNKVAVRMEFTGTQTGPMGDFPASGKKLTATYLAIYRVENGVIKAAWAEWDNLSGLSQLGHFQAAETVRNSSTK